MRMTYSTNETHWCLFFRHCIIMKSEVRALDRYELTVLQTNVVGYHLFVTFEKPNGFQFVDGQYGIFLHVDKEVEGRKMRAFSIASSNQEDTILIGTKLIEPISSFKQHMIALEPGDTMTLSGPTGSFTLEDGYPIVFIAGGIGITPIRSMIQGLAPDTPATLVFSEANRDYPMIEAVSRPFVSTKLVSGREETATTISQTVLEQIDDTYYYIAGSIGFVNGISEQLQQLGIAKDHIKFDRFTGY